ncbi:hypothetical protein QDA00_gp52 [Microbacterium phage Matzah]|uniref:Uncharacterized protein n=1 Tax=Microbacterium phage Matzah TaxID=2686228 RepID=A0A6B9LCP3_9CAUD|nr:hypothetical protein QDA00_gp52 [Microbacterium phage Matzah]QHB37051.1 hypothetical protein SEA_MATZAH_58 [Microbacterium phage Matzah]
MQVNGPIGDVVGITPTYEAVILPGMNPAGGMYGIHARFEAEGRVVAVGATTLPPLTEKQARHLMMSLAQVLGVNTFEAINTDEKWRRLRDALNAHREHEGVEPEVHDARGGGWADVRDYLPEQYRH